ncbi:MAG: hypothetical protein EZS28_010491 [Streblomastix strix]|uniref:Uncharacterized protein n=1 Tax=Streblomastix strix TaxID=222440 RepID=A0A5J4WGB9_9EUKA|nr:MAG: hypothetical protein EZS28_010491 [Streblomastix strix]
MFEVSAVTNYLSNRVFDRVASQNIIVNQSTDEFIVTNCTFRNCGNSTVSGGALYIQLSNGGHCQVANTTFTNCSSSYGGAIYAQINSGGNLTINRLCSFTDCYAYGQGGGICAYIYGQNSRLLLLDGLKFERCHSNYGGGGLIIYAYQGAQLLLIGQCSFRDCFSLNAGEIQEFFDGGGLLLFSEDQCLLSISSTLYQNCSSETGGGGLLASVLSRSQLVISSCQFIRCSSFQGNGGGIYIILECSSNCSFIIIDTIVQECKVSKGSFYQSGFGGGLHIEGLGDYKPQYELIDLRGLKIYNNSAEIGGQSLFVAMTKVVEWCQYGILGEYVKGNYSDRYSNERDLEGIPMDLSTFNSSSLQTIVQQQQPLEHFWRILGILKSAQVIVNVSNPNGKLFFHLKGQRMFQEYLHTADQQQSDLDIGMPTLIKDRIVSEEQAQILDDGFQNHKKDKYFIIGEPVLIKDKIVSEEEIEEEQENNKQNNNKRDEQKMNQQILIIGEPILIKDKEVKEEDEQEEIVKQKKNEKENKDQLIIGNPILIKDKEVNEKEINQQKEQEKESHEKRKHKVNQDQFDIGKQILIKEKHIREELNVNVKQNENKDRIRQKHELNIKEQDEEKKKEKEKKIHQQRKQKENKANFMIDDPLLVKDRIISKNEKDIEIKKEDEQKKETNNKEKKKNKDDLNGK